MNSAPTVVLDASAMLAFLRNEPGRDRVAQALSGAAAISALNWAEVLTRLIDLGSESGEIAARALPSTGSGTVEVVPFGDHEARETARLRVRTRSLGLSLADRAALALAISLRLPVLTADRSWKSLRLPVRIEVIR